MEEEQVINKLKMHEECCIDEGTFFGGKSHSVIRVPGGLIYIFNYSQGVSSTFVSYNNFIEEPK